VGDSWRDFLTGPWAMVAYAALALAIMLMYWAIVLG
jgi:hypothetical protein